MKPDPIGEPRNGLAIYLLLVALVSGVATLLGYTPSSTIEVGLDPLLRHTWAVILAGGSAAALIGMFWPGDARTGLVLKRLGYVALVVAGIVYSLVVYLRFGWGGFTTGSFILGFAIACWERARHVSRVIRRIVDHG